MLHPYLETSLAKDIAELKTKEQALIENLAKEEDFKSNEAEIEALENLDHERISIDFENFNEIGTILSLFSKIFLKEAT